MAKAATASWMRLALLLPCFLSGEARSQPADAPGPAPAVAVDYDFRGSKPLPAEIRPAGALHNLVIRPEEAGVRLTIVGDRPNPIGRAGLEMKTRLVGDFEITAGYEILRADIPTDGTGVGFEFFAHTVHTPQQGVGLYRMTRVGEDDVYFVSRNFIKDGKPGWDQKKIPTKAKSGRLRIARTGKTASFSAAEGESDAFKELSRKELGAEDITVIWLMAYTGHAQYAVDLRVHDLKIRAGVPIAIAPPLPRIADGDSGEATPDSEAHWLSRRWRFLALSLIVLVLGMAAVVAFVRRRRADSR